ncbi:hypothetical protein BV25DRAFT_1933830 [Artomyces pyxidatus]|uniref:Uncharacterized protein n=1 Tax=Artomyces pyxidatus TaxID=48021 RepID=A0ACB8T5Q7_9AGAM|nr:hypothetical protein BV25DRAFT_1933830 [Artomyces pyxidatus]
MQSRQQRGTYKPSSQSGARLAKFSVSDRGTNFEHIASVSRSSGLEKDGDTLKNFDVQEEYRVFVQGKVDDYWAKFPRNSDLSESEDRRRAEVQGNLLILFRKLREGISSSKRRDAFAVEVYETSLYLSIIFQAPAQTTSILSHLLPDLYESASTPSSSSATVLLASLHSLVIHYPSQRPYFEWLGTLPRPYTLTGEPQTWIQDVSRCLRRCEYLRLGVLTQRATLSHLIEFPPPRSGSPGSELREEAFHTLIGSLRTHARTTAWRIVRNAYREFGLRSPSTKTWIARTLLLDGSHPSENEAQDVEKARDPVDLWFTAREKLGEIGRKEGSEASWLVKLKT